ncbi:MAG: glycosyltransferase family 4 protein [Methylovirgula sp.]
MNNSDSITIVICSEIADPDWRWIESNLGDCGVTFEFVHSSPEDAHKKVRFLNFTRLRGSFEAISLAKRRGAKAVVAHGATWAAWCGVFARMLGLKVEILGHSFNFTVLPTGIKRAVFTLALSKINRFVVFSSIERELYAKTFALPAERFDVVLWGVRPPQMDTAQARLEQGEYVCAIGGNARDYRTLVEAARQLPALRFVLVVRPESLRGLDLPANVAVHVNLSYSAAMNVLQHSRFMVLPLISSMVPCGHVTMVAAMYLAKAFIVTASLGVRDYAREGDNALTVTAGSVDSLVAAIKRLWEDPALCERLGDNGQKFATRECTEERVAEHFCNWLDSRRLSAVSRETQLRT